MTERSRSMLCGLSLVAMLGAIVAVTSACGLLAGTLDGPCDPPTSVAGASPDPIGRRRGNCQPQGSVCCRRSSTALQTLCTYPENCYDAPFMGSCAIPADCNDSQACSMNHCQCPSSQPVCNADAGLCCESGETCIIGRCFIVDAGTL